VTSVTRGAESKAAGDPLAPARAILLAYEPRDAEQAATRARMLAFLDAHPEDAHRRELEVGHLTAAAFVVDARAERALLTHHRKLGRWLQLGGHCDGDPDLVRVALREGTEESGIEGLVIEPLPIDLDIHAIPGRPGEPEHLHHDVRFLVHAPRGARFEVSDESLALGWFAPDELDRIETDASVRRLFEVVFG
jgi:8-oxo-dGTP pyrophosphatase MutT (NUDIX family)